MHLHKFLILIFSVLLVSACSTAPRNITTSTEYRNNYIRIGGGDSESQRQPLADKVCSDKLGHLFTAQAFGASNRARIDGETLDVQLFNCKIVPQEGVTGLALKSMQSRKFKATPSELVDAVRTYALDRNGQCALWGEAKPIEYSSPVMPTSKNEIDCAMPYSKTMGLIYQRILASYSYENEYTILRLRIYIPRHNQITEGALYSELFKHIANQLFVDAIKLSPTEMK